MAFGELPDQPERWPELNPPRVRRDFPAAPPAPVSGGGVLDKFVRMLKGLTFYTQPRPIEFFNVGAQVGSTWVQVLGRRETRYYLLIQNKSVTDSIFVSFGQPANNVNKAVEVVAGGNYEPYIAPASEVYMYRSGVTVGDGVVVMIDGAFGGR